MTKKTNLKQSEYFIFIIYYNQIFLNEKKIILGVTFNNFFFSFYIFYILNQTNEKKFVEKKKSRT